MTAKELYRMARHLMQDNMTSKNLDEYYITDINVLIAELFNENNALRVKAHKGPLVEIPIIKSADDEIMYEPQMVYNIMPKGLAARFFIDEDDRSKYTILQSEYMNARMMNLPVNHEEGWEL